MGDHKGSLRRRITLTIITGISIILLIFGVAAHYIIQANIDHSLNEKLSLARVIGNNIDNIIRDHVSRLYDISMSGKIDLTDGDFSPERDAFKTAYRNSIFTDGVFLLDPGGNAILNYPSKIRDAAINVLSIEPINRVITLGKPVVSNIYTIEPTGKKVIFVLVPLKDNRGNSVGIAGGEIDPTNPLLTRMLGLIDMGKQAFVDLVDSNGVIISSSAPSRTLTQCNRDHFFTRIIAEKKERVTTCHSCHVSAARSEKTDMILAFTPLEMAPWGITFQEPRDDVFASAGRLKRTFLALAVIFIGTAFILTIGISRSIVDPLKDLIRGTDRIAKGDLSKPIPPQGSDEIGVLSHSFEAMRVRLVESIDHIKQHNLELETRVKERTHKINESQKLAETLLQKVITSQEDERTRIGRELHDDTLQDLSAALIQIDMCKLNPSAVTVAKIDRIRSIIVKALDGVTGVIQNLRPSLLDDLGLVPAIKSLLDMHLGANGINYFLNTNGVTERRFRPELEITLFRIVQEAVSNTARHAKAENFFIKMNIDNDIVAVDIEDDGEGFVTPALYTAGRESFGRRGLGLLGMRERVTLIGGAMHLCSTPSQGTQIEIRIPLAITEA
jgi:signal transduction histidine kinase